jgi:hypothetical protein
MSWIILVVFMCVFWGTSWGPRGRRRLSRQEEDRFRALEAELAGRDEAILGLENRVAELESRLDFTERLLSSPSDSRSVGQ